MTHGAPAKLMNHQKNFLNEELDPKIKDFLQKDILTNKEQVIVGLF